MTTKKRKIKYAKGFGLIEIMVTILILLITVTGSLAYQYFTTVNARQADQYAMASEIGNTMLETWKGLGSDNTFDPATVFISDMDIINSSTTQPAAGLSNVLGSYQINENNVNYFFTLSYQDTTSKPRLLNIVIAWSQIHHGSDTFSQTDNSITWTTSQGY
jgi:prepilin-type N-terminal cleavage/methylation domain-containing protein